jgi:hypothetical protein
MRLAPKIWITNKLNNCYSSSMDIAVAGLQYFVAIFVGLVIAVVPTILVIWAVFPSDGPIGEGLMILFIHLLACCTLVPAYVYLMSLHRQGRRDVRRLLVYDLILRSSVIVAGCFVCFMAVKLPTMIVTKLIACFLTALLGAWAIIPALWNRHSPQNATFA